MSAVETFLLFNIEHSIHFIWSLCVPSMFMSQTAKIVYFMIPPQISILILIFQQNYYTLESIMVVIFVSLSFKQHRCLKRIKDFKVLMIRADHTLIPMNSDEQ